MRKTGKRSATHFNLKYTYTLKPNDRSIPMMSCGMFNPTHR